MLKLDPYAHHFVSSEVYILFIGGLWDEPFTTAYIKEVKELMASHPNSQLFTLIDLQKWSLPSLEVLEKILNFNKFVAEQLDNTHIALILPPLKQRLFQEVTDDFINDYLPIEARPFTSFSKALGWGTELGYQKGANFDELYQQLMNKKLDN